MRASISPVNAHEFLIDTLAHVPPRAALDQLTAADAERRLDGAPHSIAAIVAHMVFWQDWFYCRCTGVAEPPAAAAALGWPEVRTGTWPEIHARFLEGLARAAALGERSGELISPAIEFPPMAHYTVGEAIVHMAQHNSHHLGQVILLRRLMGLWPPPSGSFTW